MTRTGKTLLGALALLTSLCVTSLAHAQLSIYVARHGQTDWNKEFKIQGATDNPLNTTGREQAAALAAALANIKLDAIYSSSHQRARQTAAAFEGRAPIIAMDELRERHYGKFEGASEKDVTLVADWNNRRLTLNDDMEGGESLESQSRRADKALATIRERHRNGGAVLIAAHGGINPMLIAKLIGIPVEEGAKSIAQGNDEVYRIDLAPSGVASIWKLIPRHKLNEL